MDTIPPDMDRGITTVSCIHSRQEHTASVLRHADHLLNTELPCAVCTIFLMHVLSGKRRRNRVPIRPAAEALPHNGNGADPMHSTRAPNAPEMHKLPRDASQIAPPPLKSQTIELTNELSDVFFVFLCRGPERETKGVRVYTYFVRNPPWNRDFIGEACTAGWLLIGETRSK